jgi:hypothetical protein
MHQNRSVQNREIRSEIRRIDEAEFYFHHWMREPLPTTDEIDTTVMAGISMSSGFLILHEHVRNHTYHINI